MKGYRIEIAGYEFVQYVVAESASKAKAHVKRQADNADSNVEWGDLRSCRRWPALDGKEPGTHATYQFWGNQECRIMGSAENKTEVLPDAPSLPESFAWWN